MSQLLDLLTVAKRVFAKSLIQGLFFTKKKMGDYCKMCGPAATEVAGDAKSLKIRSTCSKVLKCLSCVVMVTRLPRPNRNKAVGLGTKYLKFEPTGTCRFVLLKLC